MQQSVKSVCRTARPDAGAQGLALPHTEHLLARQK